MVLIYECSLTYVHTYMTCFQHCPLISDNGPVKSTGPGSLNPLFSLSLNLMWLMQSSVERVQTQVDKTHLVASQWTWNHFQSVCVFRELKVGVLKFMKIQGSITNVLALSWFTSPSNSVNWQTAFFFINSYMLIISIHSWTCSVTMFGNSAFTKKAHFIIHNNVRI